jgi:hypothetical protein
MGFRYDFQVVDNINGMSSEDWERVVRATTIV